MTEQRAAEIRSRAYDYAARRISDAAPEWNTQQPGLTGEEQAEFELRMVQIMRSLEAQIR
ncbi:hypothetical protein [Streptomyces sp. NPDC046859]|uniref:hypothetical protein n=1 Tax=Streptomyces sp. NPDC046859 TaxID=3155734 RepID=UPI0033CE21BB